MKHNSNCEFCSELNEHSLDSSFLKIYSGLIDNRVIFETAKFRVLPTLGQMFQNSLLIVSKEHIETMAKFDNESLEELNNLYSVLKNKLSSLGSVIGFEHGAYCENGGGCGIYHAHIHIIPLPSSVNMTSFFKSEYTNYDSLTNALVKAKDLDEYLMTINEDLSIGLANISKHTVQYGSQFFRKKLQEHFNLSLSWNWKDYYLPEPLLLNSVKNSIFVNS